MAQLFLGPPRFTALVVTGQERGGVFRREIESLYQNAGHSKRLVVAVLPADCRRASSYVTLDAFTKQVGLFFIGVSETRPTGPKFRFKMAVRMGRVGRVLLTPAQ